MISSYMKASYYLHNHRLHLLLLERKRMFLSYLFTMLLYTDNWKKVMSSCRDYRMVCGLSFRHYPD